MQIPKYELLLDIETKLSHLKYKETFSSCNETFTTPLSIFTFMTEVVQLHQMSDEYVYLLALNQKMRVIGLFEVSHGTGTASLLDARGVFMRALYVGANQIVLIHNHPSGDVEPSKQDITITKVIKEAGQLLAIPLVDHIIVGSDTYFSFRESNLL